MATRKLETRGAKIEIQTANLENHHFEFNNWIRRAANASREVRRGRIDLPAKRYLP